MIEIYTDIYADFYAYIDGYVLTYERRGCGYGLENDSDGVCEDFGTLLNDAINYYSAIYDFLTDERLSDDA